MTTTGNQEYKLAKYEALLGLALAQIDAIDSRDQSRLNLIIEQKWSVIRTLAGTRELLKTEPELAEIVRRIQDADRLAENKLAARMGDVQIKLCQLNKKAIARNAYVQTGRKKHPIMGLNVDDNTPRFFDCHS